LRGQLGEGRDHARQPVGVFGAVARIQPNLVAVLDDLEPKPIPLRLVQPIIALGRSDGCRGGEGADKRETAHQRHPAVYGVVDRTRRAVELSRWVNLFG
jgi:hypothetical protein